MTERIGIHLVGIGGVGMAGLAVLLKARGHAVSGCDLKATPRTRWLEAQGIPVAIGHSPDHVRDADLVVVTPAVRADNPELRAARSVRSRGAVLAGIVGGCDAIAVCGSHGKTTTATWIAKLLAALGEDPSWCIGGETGAFPVAGVGTGPLVVEADESDGTLSLYRARTLVVNRCEYDHPDHFRTEADYFACYEAARRNAADVVDSEALAPLADVGFLAALAPHNRANARAAVEVALRRGHALPEILAALEPIVAVLPDRRFERIAAGVYADYAHHPTEMACAIRMARRLCAGTLRVLFQPHRYSRTKALLGDFPAAFAEADEVILCPTYAAFEEPLAGGDVTDLHRACREVFAAAAAGGRVAPRLFLAPSCAAAWARADAARGEGDLTLLLGAGDIIDLAPIVRAARSPVLILGYGGSGRAAEALLKRRGRETVVLDGEAAFPEGDFAGAVVSPGIALTHPWIRACVARGIPLKSELQLGCEELKRLGWKLLAVTGSKGKSSVVKIVADAIVGAGGVAVPCGNYGRPVCDVGRDATERVPPWAVVEVSSFQLETTNLPADTFEAAAILNLQEDHLDRHGSVAAYHALKRRLLAMTHRPLVRTEAPGASEPLLAGSYFDNAVLRGNGLFAIGLMKAAGLGDGAIRRAFAEFVPLPHRMNSIAEIGGVRYVDDSKATSIAALVAGVSMAAPRVRLIAGGLPKGDDPKVALPVLTNHVKKVYLIGQSAECFLSAWRGAVDCEVCRTLDRAVEKAKREAERGETVLLSPGTASFDQFRSFGERGEVFARLVKKEREEKK